jgi:CBS domain-containing protein
MAEDRPGELSLFLRRVCDLMAAPPVTCTAATSVLEIARLLARRRVGSVIVVDDSGRAVGIITDRDLRGRVVAEGRDPAATPAAAVMSAPLVGIGAGALAFEALLEMTRQTIHHLGVLEEGRLVGVLSTNDFLRVQTVHPVILAREIERARSVESLTAAARQVTALVQRLIDEGGTAHEVGRIVSELNDRLVARALSLAAATLAAAGESAPPVPYCWLGFGSEARREQTLRTDQDNGLVYADPPPGAEKGTADYYARFAAAVVEALVAIGFPPCPGGAMASNPRWCQPLSVWTGYFRHWIHEPEPEEVLAACIYFDLRPLAGDDGLAAPLLAVVHEEAPSRRLFLGLLARDVVSRRPPLTVFGNVAVQRSGPDRGTVDVKGAGVMQFVGAARVHALELSLPETNTNARFRGAAERGLYTPEESREITDACAHLMRLRLVHQLQAVARGEAPDNRVNPARLSRADALLFRDALKTVVRVQAGLRERFGTDLIA